MDKSQILLLSVLEAIGLILIVRVWCKSMPVIRKVALSAILLVPLFGPLMYLLVGLNPARHEEDVPDSTGMNDW
jgi:hypothetical protein